MANVDIDLGVFTNAWLAAGGKVTGGRVYKDEQGKTKIRITTATATIVGVPIAASKLGGITTCIYPKRYSPNKLYLFNLQQMDGKTILGGEQFNVRFSNTRKTTL